MTQRGLTASQITVLVMSAVIIVVMIVGALGMRAQLEGAMVLRQQKAARAHADLTVDENNLRLLVAAVEGYRRDHAGKMPDFPSRLVPHYLAVLPTDPANGLPYAILTPARSGALYEIDDAGGLPPAVVKARYGVPARSLLYDLKGGLAVRTY